jgi:MFS family permease
VTLRNPASKLLYASKNFSLACADPLPRQRGLYFGILGGVYAIAISSGPLIGGVIAENIGWRWCFYINLPLQGISFALLVFFLHVHDPRTEIIKGLMAVDWLGSIALTGSVVMLLLGLQYGGEIHPWGSAIVVCRLRNNQVKTI